MVADKKESVMREYLSNFFSEFDYSAEDTAELLSAYDKIALNAETAEILDGILAEYDATLKINAKELMPKCERIAELISVHQYTTKLLVHICLSRRLRRYYAEKGVDDALWFNAMLDLKYKLIECRLIEGIAGTFVADGNWFSRWYDMTRFALGRLQFEILPFRRSYEKDGKSLNPDSKVLNIHIPRTGTPLDRESVQTSYSMAREFFKDEFGDEPIAFVCSSWLLFPEQEKILHEKSNIRKFMSDFDIIESKYYDDNNCSAFWRIFDKPYTDNFDEIPEDTFLKRAYKEYLKNGGKLGYGFGVFF